VNLCESKQIQELKNQGVSMFESSHKRYNPLLDEWVLVSPHRTKRPWQGAQEDPETPKSQEFDPGCYLCPGNTRANGETNPKYTSTYSFVNDFSALLPDEQPVLENAHELFARAEAERGICKVICFSPRHDLTMARMNHKELSDVIHLWKQEYLELSQHDFIHHIQIFENRGATMGSSNPHPHGQVWANETLPEIPKKKDQNQRSYFEKNQAILLMDYADFEKEQNLRIVRENNSFLAVVPFWAVWPYELLILPKKHHPHIGSFSDAELEDLASICGMVGVMFDNLFKCSFPYSMGLHQAPVNSGSVDYWQFHISYKPPLLRSASVKKFMVGYELLAMAQRDITAEQAAEKLRNCSSVHYLEEM
jgi:UDPglucose--hexose-1-phosphate uridylyltransferase